MHISYADQIKEIKKADDKSANNYNTDKCFAFI